MPETNGIIADDCARMFGEWGTGQRGKASRLPQKRKAANRCTAATQKWQDGQDKRSLITAKFSVTAKFTQ